MKEERRDYPRLAISLEALIYDPDDAKGFIGAIIDISFNGVCIVSPVPLFTGEWINFKVFLETGEIVHLTAEVRWQNIFQGKSFRAGLLILSGKDDDLAKFKKYYNLRLLYPPATN